MPRIAALLLFLAFGLSACGAVNGVGTLWDTGDREFAPSKTQEIIRGHVLSCNNLATPWPGLFCIFPSDDGVDGYLFLPQNVAMEAFRYPPMHANEHLRVMGRFDVARSTALLKVLDPYQRNQSMRSKFIFYVEGGKDIQRLDLAPPE